MDKLEMTPEQQLAFDGFIDVMVQIYKMTSDFRKPAEEAESEQDGELFSDNTSRVDLVSHVVKTRLIPLAIIFLCCVLPNFVRVTTGTDGSTGGLHLLFSIIFGLMFVIYVFLIVHCGTKLRKLKMKYGG